MQYDPIALPENTDYPTYNEDDSSIVLRVHSDRDKYIYQYLGVRIGEIGGEYDTLIGERRVVLTRRQVSKLAQQLVSWLAAQ